MKRIPSVLLAPIGAAVLLAVLVLAPAAQAEFGLSEFDVTFTGPPPAGLEPDEGPTANQAGSHPFQVTTTVRFLSEENDKGGWEPEEAAKDLLVTQVPGIVGAQGAVLKCSSVQFLSAGTNLAGAQGPGCSDATAVGLISVTLASKFVAAPLYAPVYNLEPPPRKVAKLGFWIGPVPVSIELGIGEERPYRVFGGLTGISQLLEVVGSELTLWGVPGDSAHDELRGRCLALSPKDIEDIDDPEPNSLGECAAGGDRVPFLTLPRACVGPLRTDYRTDSWQNPGAWIEGFAETHDAAGNPQGFTGCGKLGLAPTISSKLSSDRAESGAGLDFSLDLADEGLQNPDGVAQSDIKKAVVTLPKGVTINPSVGEGLNVCTPAQLDRETPFSEASEGCPNASKLGSLHVETPLLDQDVGGSIFLAQQDDPKTAKPGAENPFDTLIALYFVLKDRDLGVIIKEPVKVEPDPRTGQLVVTLDDNPQLPFSRFEAHLRTGARAALITPNACGTHVTEARFYPWTDPNTPVPASASFNVNAGVNGGRCPAGGIPPFAPGFEAGSVNNNAGSFSPFVMRLQREDGEQNMTKFSSLLPPGVLGSLAGVAKCPDIAVPTAKSKTGRQELAAPSCPVSSQIGRTLAGAGVGSALTYVGGQVYLAGPYKGAPLSVIAITPAVAGPFDAGTVVVRLGLDLDPKTAEVSVDGAASDPIPHIIKGIVLKLRDLRVHVDRPNFTLNPTSCDPSSAKARLFGSFLNVIDPGDDRPVDLATRYQAANCLNLGFDPKLGLKLKGGTKRGGHPGLKAVYTPKPGDANIEGLVVRLPRSAFLDQAHIRTICTRVQYAAQNCPQAAQYGYIRAWTPLLDEPLQGPVWLRSSNHKLPDLVFDLKGLVDIEVSVRIDSARGGIRATLVDAPDAPLSRVVLNMQGGKKGLIINSRNLCARKSRANVKSTGQNGKLDTKNPVMRPQCKRRKAKRSSHGRAARGSVAASSAVG